MHFLLYPQPLHLYLLFCYHNLCLAYILPVLTTKPTPYWNFTSSFDFDHVSSAACDFASAYQVSSKLDHLLLSCDVISIFRDGGHSVGNLRIPVWWRLALEEVKDYPCTELREDTCISIYSRYITTSGFWKQTDAILKYYIRFQFWYLLRHGNAILHRYAKFRPNQTIRGGVMTSWRFSRWQPSAMLDLL